MALKALFERRRREDRGAVGAEGVVAGGVSPLAPARGSGERCELPQRVRAEPGRQTFLVHFVGPTGLSLHYKSHECTAAHSYHLWATLCICAV